MPESDGKFPLWKHVVSWSIFLISVVLLGMAISSSVTRGIWLLQVPAMIVSVAVLAWGGRKLSVMYRGRERRGSAWRLGLIVMFAGMAGLLGVLLFMRSWGFSF